MLKLRLLALAAASVVLHSTSVPAFAGSGFAARVLSYDPGLGATPQFLNPDAALGEPSRINPFGEPTDPFNPPYGTNQLVSIGTGGSLVLEFQNPILNHRHNLLGLDFNIFGNTGFIITNEFDLVTFDWIGTPATDGSLFAQSTGETRVSVSRDGVNFYLLNPLVAPPVDSFPPTDGAGDFQAPLLPELAATDFAGATLADIRTLYAGSAGGASYDIAWAQDVHGRAVHLPNIRFVRIEVLSGKAEIDALAVIARDPRAQP